MRADSMRVVVVGAGYVGLTTAVALAYLGHRVVGVEKDQAKLFLLRRGESPMYETGLSALMEEGSRLSVTDRLKEIVGIVLGKEAKGSCKARVFGTQRVPLGSSL